MPEAPKDVVRASRKQTAMSYHVVQKGLSDLVNSTGMPQFNKKGRCFTLICGLHRWNAKNLLLQNI
jgi:hypothetical protein